MDEKWTEEDDAAVHAEGLPDDHPARFIDVLRLAAEIPKTPESDAMILAFVTPESASSWGSQLEGLREYMRRGFLISTRVLHQVDAPDVAYVKFAANRGRFFVDEADAVEATGYATVVWRPELAAPYSDVHWRLH